MGAVLAAGRPHPVGPSVMALQQEATRRPVGH